ncbi:MAG: hypothetical protein R3E73_01810 [Porticoccaceae bacterium]|nr:hypothetical protein [Pseudomonadales bacterium]MCP5173044.1 hypothetical protein [Pseudomonadales bacterium]MCP5302518.1 hypothetical protein [Pseudomonadales bacterium]
MVDSIRPGSISAVTKTRPVTPGKTEKTKDQSRQKKGKRENKKSTESPRPGMHIDEHC